MKRILFGLIICATFVGVGFILFIRDKAPATLSQSESDIFTVAVLSPDVSIKKDTQSIFEPASGSVEVQAGAEIKTSSSGRAKILYPNGTITTVEGDSHVVISALAGAGNESRLFLIVGSIWSKIQNILGTNEYYEVETGNIVASVRGTIFALEYRNATSTIYGIGNTVKVSAKNEAGSPIPSTNTDIESGTKVIISGTASPTSATPLPTVAITDQELNTGLLGRNLIEITDDEADNPWHKGLKELIRRLKKSSRSPSSAPAAASTSPTPTPSASLNPVIQSISPTAIKVGEYFDIIGKNFLTLTGAQQVTSVSIGSTQVQFVTQSTTVLMVIPSSVKAGTYDIHIVSTTGVKSSLTKALIIR